MEVARVEGDDKGALEHLWGRWRHGPRLETQTDRTGLGPDEFQLDTLSLRSWHSISPERLTRQMDEQVCRRHNTLNTASPSMFSQYEINKDETSFHVSVPTVIFTGWVLAEVRLGYIQLKNNCLPLLCPPICFSFNCLIQSRFWKIKDFECFQRWLFKCAVALPWKY